MAKRKPKYKPFYELRECGSCGAAIGPCSDWPWHYPSEDCRAIREPKERYAAAASSSKQNPSAVIPRRWTPCQVMRTARGQVKVKLAGTRRRR